MKRIILDDETWVYEFDMEPKQKLSDWQFEAELKTKYEYDAGCFLLLYTPNFALCLFFIQFKVATLKDFS